MHKDDLLNRFIFLMEYRNLSKHTLKMYSYYVSLFLDTVPDKEPADITLDDALHFVVQLKKTYSPQSLNVVICAIRYFFDVVLNIPLSRRQFPNISYPQKEIFIFSINQIQTLLNTKDVRMRLFILLGFDCGLRVSEVAKLRVCDIDSKNMLIHIHNSKRGKSRSVPLSHACLCALRRYYVLYDRPVEFLFPGLHGRPHVNPLSINNEFLKYIKSFDFYQPNIRFHSLRHTYATLMLENDTNIFLVKKLLGHSSFSSTARYIQYQTRDIKNISSLSDTFGVH